MAGPPCAQEAELPHIPQHAAGTTPAVAISDG